LPRADTPERKAGPLAGQGPALRRASLPDATLECDEDFERLEIACTLLYNYDHGDTFGGEHRGDSESVAVLVSRKVSKTRRALYTNHPWAEAQLNDRGAERPGERGRVGLPRELHHSEPAHDRAVQRLRGLLPQGQRLAPEARVRVLHGERLVPGHDAPQFTRFKADGRIARIR
jgi:hypothetical protein